MRTRFFASERERDRFIREFSRELATHGSEVFEMDKARVRLWQEADRLMPDSDPVELVKLWHQVHRSADGLNMREAVERYLEQLQESGRSESYLKHAQKSLTRFNAEHGDRPLDAVTAEAIREYVAQLPFQPLSKQHERTYLASAFKWFVLQGWVDRNPVDRVPIPKVQRTEPGILTVEETERLFRASETEDSEVCALLALGAFAGLRSSAIERLEADFIDLDRRSILIPSEIAKTNRRHLIEDLPENLWPWLERAPKDTFRLTRRQIALRRQHAYERAGLLIHRDKARRLGTAPKSPPKNCLRHSFVSYHVALHRDPGKTALIVSHRSQEILWQHYLGVATREDAVRYFKKFPLLLSGAF